MDELKKAISEAASVLFLLPKNATDRDYLAALQLQKMAPEKIHVVAPEDKEAAWQDAFGTSPAKKEFAIIVDTTISPVDELRYEKDNGKLSIFLSHRHRFNREAIRFEESLPQADLVVTMGFPTRLEAERFVEALPGRGGARHLCLTEDGAEMQRLPSASANLLGRIMARSREDLELGALWSFITRDDFLKTSARPEEIPSLLRAFAKIANLPRLVIVFWQFGEAGGTQGVAWSYDKTVLAKIASGIGEVPFGEYITLPQFSNFIEAETATRKLLHPLF